MAKKRKEKTEGEELDFKLPKFDEEKFLKKERRNIKTLFISFILGLVLSLVSFGFWILLKGSDIRWYLILLLGIFGAPWLKYIYLNLNIDLTDFGRKGWFGSYLTYFFTWLIILVLLVNPPFYDEEPPRIELVTLPGMQEMGGTVEVVAYIIDNVGIEKKSIDFTLIDPLGNESSPEFSFKNNVVKYTHENPENLTGKYKIVLTAADVNGHKNNVNATFEYSNDALQIISSIFSDIRSGDVITIKADEKISSENFRVYYRINGGSEINVDRLDVDDKEKYTTSAEYKGWTENSNATVRIYTEVYHYYTNVNDNFTNTIEDTFEYNFTTGSDSSIGTEPPIENKNLSYALPRPKGLPSTPGFEGIISIIALVMVVLFFKIRKKKKK